METWMEFYCMRMMFTMAAYLFFFAAGDIFPPNKVLFSRAIFQSLSCYFTSFSPGMHVNKCMCISRFAPQSISPPSNTWKHWYIKDRGPTIHVQNTRLARIPDPMTICTFGVGFCFRTHLGEKVVVGQQPIKLNDLFLRPCLKHCRTATGSRLRHSLFCHCHNWR